LDLSNYLFCKKIERDRTLKEERFRIARELAERTNLPLDLISDVCKVDRESLIRLRKNKREEFLKIQADRSVLDRLLKEVEKLGWKEK